MSPEDIYKLIDFLKQKADNGEDVDLIHMGRRVYCYNIFLDFRIWITRKIFFLCGISDVEDIGICLDESLANNITSSIKGGYHHKSPLVINGDEQLPEETGQYKTQSFPKSKNNNDYQTKKLTKQVIDMTLLRKLNRNLDEVLKR